MKASKNWVVQKALLGWKPNPRASQQKKQSQQQKDQVRRKKEEHVRWWLKSLQICWPRGQPRSNAWEAVRSNAWESLSLASRSNGQHSNLMEKPENTVDHLLRRSRYFPVTTPVTGATKTSRNRSNHIWFCSFFHKDFKYASSFQRNITEKQKRSEQSFKIKTRDHDSARIGTN
jgi:hypothetical protein